MTVFLGFLACTPALDTDESAPADPADLDHDGYNPNQGDCNEEDASVNPGANEVPGNDIDENCDYTLFPATPIPDVGHLVPAADQGSLFGFGLDVASATPEREGTLLVYAPRNAQIQPEIHVFTGAEAFAADPVAGSVLYHSAAESSIGEDARFFNLADGSRAIVSVVDTQGWGPVCVWPTSITGRADLSEATCLPSAEWDVASLWGGFGSQADVDGDGELDLVAHGVDADLASGLWWIPGPLDLAAFAHRPRRVAFDDVEPSRVWTPGDLDGNGDGDIATYAWDEAAPRLTIYQGGGGLGVAATLSAPDPAFAGSFAFGDLDGDGKLDACGYLSSGSGTEKNTGTVACFLGPFTEDRSLNDAFWSASGEGGGSTFGSRLAALDWDHDGDDDLVVRASTPYTDRGLVYIFDPGSGSDVPLAVFTDPEETSLGSALAEGDLDGDGLDDLAIAAIGYEDLTGAVWLLAGSEH